MSIQINQSECVGCGCCVEACSGNLIKRNAEGKALIRRPRDCWGCTACLKACPTGAVKFFLGADIGGRGSLLSVKKDGPFSVWTVTRSDGTTQTIRVNKNDSNQY